MVDLEFLSRAQRLYARTRNSTTALDGRITSISEDRFVAEIAKDERPTRLKSGDSLSIEVLSNDGRYTFQSAIVSVDEGEAGFKVGLAFPKHVEKTQLREYAREMIRLPVKFTYTPPQTDGNGPVPSGQKVAQGNTLDVSAGGLRVRVERFGAQGRPILGTLGRVEFAFPKGSPIHSAAKVVWIRRFDQGSALEFALEFQGMGTVLRDRIVRHIFSHQAELRRRGLV